MLPTSQTKNDVFTIINNRILEQLEHGTIPWQQPWKDAGPPKNFITGRNYRGINVLLLASLGFELNLFLTLKQVNELGAKIKKGEHACPVVFWSKKEVASEKEGEKEEKRILRYYSVFNLSQCTGIPIDRLPEMYEQVNDPISACEEVINNMPSPPKIIHKSQDAYYNHSTDKINMPKRNSFSDSEGYYGVLFHELVHSTGHTSRLNRDSIMKTEGYGSDIYSEEELIAQIGSCFLASHTGTSMKHFENDVAYIDGWLKQLKNDKRMLLFASSKAQRAVDYILDRQFTEEKEYVEDVELKS